MKRKILKNAVVILFGVLAVALFYRNTLFHFSLPITPYVGTNDLLDLNIPFRSVMIESLKKGMLPLWSAQISAGYPLMAEEICVLYPVCLISSLMPLSLSIKFWIFTSYLLLYLFSFYYLKKIKLENLSSAFGALAITFCGFAVNQIMHLEMVATMYLLMGEMAVLEAYLESKKSYLVLVMAFLLGLMFLGGHPQIILYSMVFLTIYWFFWGWVRKHSFKRTLISILVFVIFGVGIGAVQLLPTLEFIQNSTRSAGLSAESIARYSFDFRDLKTFALPFSTYLNENSYRAAVVNGWPRDEMYVYPGILVLILSGMAVFGSFRSGKGGLKDKPDKFYLMYTWFFVIWFFISLILSFGTKLPTGFIFTIPPFSFFRIPFRFLMLTNISLGVLSAFGFSYLSKYIGTKFTGKFVLIGLLTVLTILLLADDKSNRLRLYPEIDGEKWYQTPEVVPYLKENIKNNERVAIEPYGAPFLKVFINNPDLWKKDYFNKDLRNTLPIFNNVIYGISENMGALNSSGLKLDRFTRLEYEIFVEGLKYQISGSITPTDTYLFLNRLTGVRYILTTSPLISDLTHTTKTIDFKESDGKLYVNEFLDYYPRAFIVPRAEKKDSEEIYNELTASKVFDPLKVVYLEEDFDGWGAKGGLLSSLNVNKYEDQGVQISYESSADGFLFLSDTYYPGWRAYVDGKEEKIYQADYAFRAIKVSAGKHEVAFKYEPESVKYGISISLITGGIFLVFLIGITIVKITQNSKLKSQRYNLKLKSNLKDFKGV